MSSSRMRWTWTLCIVGLFAAASGCESEGPSVPSRTSGSGPASSGKRASDSPSKDPHAADPHAADPHAGLVMPEKKDAADEKLDTAGGELALDEATFTAPAGWGRKPLGPGGFIDAEYALPRAEGDDADGRLTVSRAGGSIDANIDRWRSQFGGKPEKDSKTEIEVDGLKVIIVDLSGEFNDQRGPFAPPTKKAGYRMLAAILPIGGQPYFVNATGPAKTIESHADAVLTFVKSAKAKKT